MQTKKDSIGKRIIRFLEHIAMPGYSAQRDAAEYTRRMNEDTARKCARDADKRHYRRSASEIVEDLAIKQAEEQVEQWRKDYPEIPRAYWGGATPFKNLADMKKAHEEFAQAVVATEAFKAMERAVAEAPPGITDRPARAFNIHVICSNEHVAVELARLILAKSIPDLYAGDYPMEGRKTRDWRDKLRMALWCHTRPMQRRYRPYRVKCQQAEGGYVPVEAVELDAATLEPKK